MAKHADAKRQLNGSPPVADDHNADEHEADDRKAPTSTKPTTAKAHEDLGDSAETNVRQRRSGARVAIAVGTAVVAALVSLTGWLGSESTVTASLLVHQMKRRV
jgi:hypothetical protein